MLYVDWLHGRGGAVHLGGGARGRLSSTAVIMPPIEEGAAHGYVTVKERETEKTTFE